MIDNPMTRTLRNFWNDESGNAAIELILCVPIMTWALLSTMVYFDAYHDEAISTRAGLVIADMYSRETANITPQYLNSTSDLLQLLTETEESPGYRVTVFSCNKSNPANDCRYDVVWSRHRDMSPRHNNSRLRALSAGLPDMADGDRAILVETETNYNADFTVSISPFIVPNMTDVTFRTFNVISPRFEDSVCWDQDPSDPNNAVLC